MSHVCKGLFCAQSDPSSLGGDIELPHCLATWYCRLFIGAAGWLADWGVAKMCITSRPAKVVPESDGAHLHVDQPGPAGDNVAQGGGYEVLHNLTEF